MTRVTPAQLSSPQSLTKRSHGRPQQQARPQAQGHGGETPSQSLPQEHVRTH